MQRFIFVMEQNLQRAKNCLPLRENVLTKIKNKETSRYIISSINSVKYY